ncbi:nuclear transport factor 2 family protein [Micromonospora chaiyaphumensis]|uniref:nuclear transport factor 2 family protein n=1 Tax=Micromonospora chaiyaphumensis TaxID=307119 RepID=UPI001428C029|nr:nuclear transport factor 2 family protein [Micromonospora chaiyaphumensis]
MATGNDGRLSHRVRAVLRHYIDHSGADEDAAHEIYHDDAVLEFPQSGERFEGVANFREWRRAYPADVDLEVVRVRGGGDAWVAELRIRYDGGEWRPAVDILEFRGDRVARETIYVTEPFPAPEWRSRWRAAPGRDG